MRGSNKLVFCEAEMMEAMEYYLTNYLFRADRKVVVTGVKFQTEMHVGGRFEIALAEEFEEVEAGGTDRVVVEDVMKEGGR